MHLFIFEWTPTLQNAPSAGSGHQELPLGHIFSCYMVAMMIGSRGFDLLVSSQSSDSDSSSSSLSSRTAARRCRNCLTMAFVLGAAAFYISAAPQFDRLVKLGAFCTFEVAVGVYYPSLGVIKAARIPESLRTTISSLLRTPLNVIVVATLFGAKELNPALVLQACGVGLSIATVLSFVSSTLESKVDLATVKRE